jgi:hypothetical protein
MSGACRTLGGEENATTVLTGKPEGKGRFRRSWRIVEDNFKVDLTRGGAFGCDTALQAGLPRVR